MTTTTDTERAQTLATDLFVAAVDFTAAMELAASFAHRLADVEAAHRAALAQAGLEHRGPSPRELAAEVALGALRPLGPHLPMVTAESAAHAREQLLEPPAENVAS